MAETTPEGSDPLAAARGGSREALGRALAEHHAFLLALARERLPHDLQAKGGASDLVQEALLNACAHFDQARCATPAQLRAWLRTILLNQLADFRKRYHAGGKRDPGLEVPLAPDGSSAGAAGGLADGSTSPSGRAAGAELDRAVEQSLRRLPEDYRRVIELRLGQGLPFEEVGRALGVSANAAAKLFARAVRRTRSDLEGRP
jgi:RNA polymerase sigma-70 factor (ECF subfamily)